MKRFNEAKQLNLWILLIIVLNFSVYIVYSNVSMEKPRPIDHLHCPNHPTFFLKMQDVATPDFALTIDAIIDFILIAICTLLLAIAYMTSYKMVPAVLNCSLITVKCMTQIILLAKETMNFGSTSDLLLNLLYTTCPIIPMWLNTNMELAALRLVSVIVNTLFLPKVLIWSIEFYMSEVNVREERPFRNTFVRFPTVDDNVPEVDDLPTYEDCMRNNTTHRDDNSDNSDDSFDSGYGYFSETYFLREDDELPSYEDYMRANRNTAETADEQTENKDIFHPARSHTDTSLMNEDETLPSYGECMTDNHRSTNTQTVEDDSNTALLNKNNELPTYTDVRKNNRDIEYSAFFRTRFNNGGADVFFV